MDHDSQKSLLKRFINAIQIFLLVYETRDLLRYCSLWEKEKKNPPVYRTVKFIKNTKIPSFLGIEYNSRVTSLGNLLHHSDRLPEKKRRILHVISVVLQKMYLQNGEKKWCLMKRIISSSCLPCNSLAIRKQIFPIVNNHYLSKQTDVYSFITLNYTFRQVER